MKQRLIPFSVYPASWGLKGDAFAVAEAHYLYDGEELERQLAKITYRDNPNGLALYLAEVDFRHGHIDAYQYDHRSAELQIPDPDALQLRKLDIEVMHGKLTAHEAARQKVNLKFHPGVERDVAMLEVEHQFNKISKNELEKQKATLLDQPWVAIINSGFDPDQGIDGVFFEFDWNTQWIEFLKLNGYVGGSAEQIVDDWFTEVCRSHSPAELAGSMTPSRNLHRS